MSTDYLEDIITSVKKGSVGAQQDVQGTQKVGELGDVVAGKEPLGLNEQVQEASQEQAKLVDDEEKIARQVTKEDMQRLSPEQEAMQKQNIERSAIEIELDENKKTEVKSYGKVKIYRVPGKPLAYYFIPTVKPTAIERRMINTLKEATTRLISITPYKIRNVDERRIVYKQKVIEIIKNNLSLKIPESKINFYAEAVVREMVGYGLIDELIKDDNLEEIMIVGPKKPVYVFHREFEMMLTNIEFFSEQEIEELLNKIAREVGRRVDVASPLLDARLPDGSRVNATIPPASISGGTLTIRKFRQDPYSIVDLIRMGTISSEAAAFLWVAVEGMNTKPANILISGGTGSGKTTLLNVLASFIPDRERIITIEDTAELNLPIKHWIRLESRPPGLEGTGELKMDILTKNSLRMRPDRIIVGEIRHEEAFTLFTAMNTGHDGAVAKDASIQLSDGSEMEIERLAEKYFRSNIPVKESDYEFVEVSGDLFIPSINKKTLKIESKKVSRVWRKKYFGKLITLTLSSGTQIRLTKDHPLYLANCGIEETCSENIKVGDYIAKLDELQQGFGKLIRDYMQNIRGDIFVGLADQKIIAESSIDFEKVVSVIEEDYSGFVYDLTVEDNHNYFANGLLVSNCLGTVHANSPDETIIRLTSPPMSVPSIMMSGLDLIIVEHRYYDRKKGTIRRVSEIGEVYGALEGSPKTQIIYQRDPIKDVLERTLVESKYLKMLQSFTGMTKEGILAEIEARKNFLDTLVSRNIRGLAEVSERAKKFIQEKNTGM